jgi:hypothetical protein
MKVDLPIEQWNALDAAASRNIELLQLARHNIALAAQAQAAKDAASAEAREKQQEGAR